MEVDEDATRKIWDFSDTLVETRKHDGREVKYMEEYPKQIIEKG